jgi:hypothetical protein
MLTQPLSDEDVGWIADRIHGYREDRIRHPAWAVRIDVAIDNLLWSASVDARAGDEILRDKWVRSGRGLRDLDFQRAPSTELARDAFTRRELENIKREHIVPRAQVLRIVLQTVALEDTKRIVAKYSRVALIHAEECKKLKPKNSMPQGWADGVDWRRPPEVLPDPWQRYRLARPEAVIPRHHDGCPAYDL